MTIGNGTIEIEPVELVYDAESVVAEINRLDYLEAENTKKFFMEFDKVISRKGRSS